MNFKFEKQKSFEELHKEYHGNPHKKGSIEIGIDKEKKATIKERKDLKNQENKKILLDIYDSEELDAATHDLLASLDDEAGMHIKDMELSRAVNRPLEYEMGLKAVLEKEEDNGLAIKYLTDQKNKFLDLQDHFEKTLMKVLDQRADYEANPVTDSVVTETLKEELDARIQYVQKVQRNIEKIIDFFEAKQGECISKGLSDGSIYEEGKKDEEIG